LFKTKNRDGCRATVAISDMLLQGPHMDRKKRAFTLPDLILVVLFIGIFAAIAAPKINFAVISRQKADGLARKIVTDLRRTRMLAISNAATNTEGFELLTNPPTGPAVRTYYMIRDFTVNPPTPLDEHTIDPDVTVTSNVRGMRFGPLGNVLPSPDGYPSWVKISAEGKTYTITFVRATGTVKCVEN
jgi:type II secretory pathway pseudopilin PulG